MSLSVYVPAPGSDLREEVEPGSGMVGSPYGETGQLRVDFEGDTDLFPTYQERIRRAAERHTWERPDGSRGYPTEACAYVGSEAVTRVGWYDPGTNEVEITAEEPLEDWL